MKRVGFFRAARLVALKDLRLEWRTLETLSSTLIFSLIVLVIFNFAFGLSTLKQLGAARLVPGVIWIVIAFSAVVGMARSFQLERSSDTLSALFLAPIDRGALFAGKFAANLEVSSKGSDVIIKIRLTDAELVEFIEAAQKDPKLQMMMGMLKR